MPSKKSYLKIFNNTDFNLSVKVDDTDNYDWDGNSRPDHNFNNVTIQPYSFRKEREELNAFASSAWFTMHIDFDNGDRIRFRNDQYDAFDRIFRFYNMDGSDGKKYIVTQMNHNDEVNCFIIFPFSLNNWMEKIPDNTSLLNMAIPGTHETCALDNAIGGGIGFAKCQNWDLKTQLEKGVRYLDIRGEAREKETGNYITIKHGAIQQPYDFNEVLVDIIKFLEKNPSETILMQLKQESSKWDSEDYAKLVDQYIKKDAYKDYFYLDQKKLDLRDVRGKIVLVNRFFNSQKFGINVKDWNDDTWFSKDNGVVKYNVQDVYKVCKPTNEFARDRKMDFVNQFFRDYSNRKNQLNLSFNSAVCVVGFITPKGFAFGDNGINERTSKQHLQPNNNWNGVMLFDFIDSYASITIPYIIDTNFK